MPSSPSSTSSSVASNGRRRCGSELLSSPRPYLATDVAWYGVAVAATAVSVFVFRPVLAKLSIGPIRDALDGAPFLVKLLIAVVVFDLVSFVVHRCLHRYDRLWAIHKVHHSTCELDGFATTRTHMIENMLRFVPSQALLFVLGMPVQVVATAVAIAAIYGVSNHSNVGSTCAGSNRCSSPHGCTAVTTCRPRPSTTTAASSRSGTASPEPSCAPTQRPTNATASLVRSTRIPSGSP